MFPTYADFVEIAADVVASGNSRRMPVRSFLAYFNTRRRGKEVVRAISSKLRKLGVETQPRFSDVHIDSAINIVPRQSIRPNSIDSKKDDPEMREMLRILDDIGDLTPAEQEILEEERSPYLTIGLLASAHQKPVCVKRNESLVTATTLMITNNYSQLPVIKDPRTVIGIISWDSIGKARARAEPPKVVGDCMDNTVIARRFSDPLFDAVRDIIRRDVVVVLGNDDTISGIVTAHDIAEQFVSLSEPFLYLEQIENHLRMLLKGARFSKEEIKAFVDEKDSDRLGKDVSLDSLTFGEYVRAFDMPSVWDRLKLSLDKSIFVKELHAVRVIRNKVMHFHPDGITDEEHDTLAKTRQMLQDLQK